MEHIVNALSGVSSLAQLAAALTAVGGGAAAASGRLPRAGPGRAIVLALSSRVLPRWSGATTSQRVAEVAAVRASLSSVKKDEFVVVNGPNGVGKSCLVGTAVRDGWGVVHVSVASGKSRDEIVAAVCKATTRSAPGPSFDHEPGAARVLLFHRLFGRGPVSVILHAAECQNGDRYAQIAAASRRLVDFGYRVIVDASHDSLDPGVFSTKRGRVFSIEPMSRTLVEQLTGLGPLHAALADAGLADVVWAVLGGYPADYQQLDTAWTETGRSTDIAPVVDAFVRSLLGTAIDTRDTTLIEEPRIDNLFKAFCTADAVPAVQLNALNLVRPSPGKVLRKVGTVSKPMLVPATPALALVLRHGWSEVPTLDAIKKLIA